ncbi:MAG: DUF4367 domain-containing protein [Candidatus Microsaccharimonas sossegonensis]|uniref:DUF4367 domain-containing protein n=1 Tax=Candidatus Microsaccharimonas sossegonensis TaxID=2506948 RepID=A0A4Q0AI26_9BACT|nr:MAG: DUF4367 domain-containing protein [Candidatus Microsaccharimonas sossegonensis]
MQANKTVEINGRLYDAVTGLPVNKVKSSEKTVSPANVKKRAAEAAAQSVHAQPQRSQTLHRRAAKKVIPSVLKRTKPGQHMDITRSSKVAKFAPHPTTIPIAPPKKTIATPDIAPKAHPLAARAFERITKTAVSAPVQTSAKQVKDAAIDKVLKTPVATPVRKRRSFRWSGRSTIITAMFLVLIVGAYVIYINLASISVGFAASQAGINATYPKYKPDGYSLSQPVTYSDGTVTLKFTSNSNDSQFTIVQTRSSWDSSAVLTNVVKKAAGDNYITTQESGLTIYSYNNNVTWVNGGILYTIESNAPLSGDQIRHIATSL